MPIKRLTEDNVLKFSKLSPEEKEKRGILGRLYGKVADFTNGTRNGRRYTEELWSKLFESDLIKERFANGGIFGQLCHPDYEDVDMEKVACVMPEPPVKDKDGQLVAYIDLLDTPCGRIAYQLAKYGYKLGISSRGSGDLITGPDGEEEVDPDTYQLTAFDLVEIPAVQSARLAFVEGLDKTRYNKTLRQSLSESLKNASEADRKIMKESLNNLGINLNEDTRDIEGALAKWKEANPDVKLSQLLREYGGNIGSILYNKSEYAKFVEWAQNEHAVTINDIKKAEEETGETLDDVAPETDTSSEPSSEPEPVDMSDMGMEDTGGEDISVEPMEDTGVEEDLGTQLSDVNIGANQAAIDMTGKKRLNEEDVDEEDTDDLFEPSDSEEDIPAESDESFYVNETPYGFTEVIYKGRVITVNGDEISFELDGDEIRVESIDDAVQQIDELDADPGYHVDPWHGEDDVKVASLDGVKTMLGESMYVKKKGSYSKVAESKKSEPEPVDESYIQEMYEKYMNEDIQEDDSDTEDVGTTESEDGLVTELKESLKEAKKLQRDNLILQEKLSASSAREEQLNEELSRYKRAVASLSASSKEAKSVKAENVSLRESINLKKEKFRAVADILRSTTEDNSNLLTESKELREKNKKLNEDLEHLTANSENLTKQLNESKKMVEKYRKSYKALKESYVEAKAQNYGISKSAALKYLGESYKASEVDKTLRELSTTKANIGKLPISLNESLNVKSANSLKVRSYNKSDDDTSLDSLMSLLE